MIDLEKTIALAKAPSVTEKTFGGWIDQARNESDRWGYRYYMHGTSAIERMRGQRETILTMASAIKELVGALERIRNNSDYSRSKAWKEQDRKIFDIIYRDAIKPLSSVRTKIKLEE